MPLRFCAIIVKYKVSFSCQGFFVIFTSEFGKKISTLNNVEITLVDDELRILKNFRIVKEYSCCAYV